MGEYVTDLGNVQEGLDGYILEVRPRNEFVDEITETLDKNFENLAEVLGSDAAIVRSSDHEGVQQFLSKMKLSNEPEDFPLLIIIDKPPGKMKSGDKCIVFNLGNMRSSTEVTKVLQIITNHIQNDQFMKELSMEEKKIRLEKRIEEMIGPVGLVASVIGIL